MIGSGRNLKRRTNKALVPSIVSPSSILSLSLHPPPTRRPILSTVPKANKLTVLGDFNARVDRGPAVCANRTTLLTGRTQILPRPAEPFRGVINCPSTITDAAKARLPQVETNADLDLPPSAQETIKVVQLLSSGIAPRSDAIPPEI
ncbi:hypothetical protein SprV_0501941400 [Sparganum proliferum]